MFKILLLLISLTFSAESIFKIGGISCADSGGYCTEDSVTLQITMTSDVICPLAVDSGKTYNFTFDVVSDSAGSTVQIFNGTSTIYNNHNLTIGTNTHQFTATTDSVRISLSYGRSVFTNVFLEEIE